MKDFALKIKNYKCFGEDFQGFEQILPVNIIIGRNNSGKSSLLDLVRYAIKPFGLSQSNLSNSLPEVMLEGELLESEVKRVFSENVSQGGIPGHNHWEFGKRIVGSRLSITIASDGSKGYRSIFPNIDLPQNIIEQYLNQLASSKTNPFYGKRYKLLAAERNLLPETNGDNFIDNSGNGITTLIQRFLNRAELPSDLVEESLLTDLNKILEPDISFVRILVQQIANEKWEVFLEEKLKGRIPLSLSGSGLKTILLVLCYLTLIPCHEKTETHNYIFAFEELENNLHPALQRKLFLYLRDFAVINNTTIFLTTHSNVVIDLFSNDEEAQLIHVKHDGKYAKTQKVGEYFSKKSILEDLDIRASDLLQSNGVVWVEGPSDRIYVNKWISLWSDGQLREGAHYQCVFYGGRLLSHLTAKISKDELLQLVNIFLVNSNSAVIIDSDKRSRNQKINETKKRINSELTKANSVCWITNGKEIENYIPRDVIEKHLNISVKKPIDRYQNFSDYLEEIKKGSGKTYLSSKVNFADRVTPYFTKENLIDRFDLNENMKSLVLKIRKWNGIG